MVLSKPGSSPGHAEAGSSRQQQEAEAGQHQEQAKTADAMESDDTMSSRRSRDIPRMVVNMSMCAGNVGIIISATRRSPRMTRQERSS
jgi:hypothetical protein